MTGPIAHAIADSFTNSLADSVTNSIADAIARGHLYAVAVTATSYHSGRSYTFVQGRAGHPVWTKSRRVVLPAVTFR